MSQAACHKGLQTILHFFIKAGYCLWCVVGCTVSRTGRIVVRAVQVRRLGRRLTFNHGPAWLSQSVYGSRQTSDGAARLHCVGGTLLVISSNGGSVLEPRPFPRILRFGRHVLIAGVRLSRPRREVEKVWTALARVRNEIR
jgi:hypothetical protein